MCVSIMLAAVCFSANCVGSADKAEDKYDTQMQRLKDQQEGINDRLAEAEQKLGEKQNDLEALTQKYDALNEKIANVNSQSARLEDRMVEADTKLREAKYELIQKNKDIERSRKDYMKRIRAMYTAGGMASYENVLVNSADFYDVMMRMVLLKKVAAHDSGALEDLMEQKRSIEETQALIEQQSAQLKADMQEYADMQLELFEQQSELDSMKAQYSDVIAQLESSRSDLQAQAAQLEEDYAAVSSMAQTTTTTTTTASTTTTSKKETNASTTTTSADSEEQTTTTTTTTARQTEAPRETTTTTTQAVTTTTAAEEEPAQVPSTPSDGSRQSQIDKVIAYAKSNVGGAYVWAGSSFRATDCSGLVMLSYAQIGVSLPHLASSQAAMGTTVSYGEMQPGDCVFFGYGGISSVYHVGIYIGDGRLLHAANSSEGIIISDLASFAQYNSITTIQRYI